MCLIILTRERERREKRERVLVALLCLSDVTISVLWIVLMVPWVGLQCVIVVCSNHTVKHVQNGHSQKDQNMVFNTNYRLMQVKRIAECSKGSILQYFRPSLSYHKDHCFVYFTQVFFSIKYHYSE